MKDFLLQNWMLVIVVGLMAFGFIFLRTPGDDLASTEAFDAQRTNGEPLLVEFYTNT